MSSLQKVRRTIAHSQKSTYVWISFLSKPWNPHLSYLFVFFPSDLSNFFQKSGSITCLILWLSNFMQKIRKNWWANSTILRCEQQKQPPEVFCQKKSVLRNFAKFKGKQVCHRCFSVNFAKLPRAPFLRNTSGRLFLEQTNRRTEKLTNRDKSIWHFR